MFRPNQVLTVAILLALCLRIQIMDYNRCILSSNDRAYVGAIEDYWRNATSHVFFVRINSYQVDKRKYYCHPTFIITCSEKSDVQVGDTVTVENIDIKPPKTTSQAFFFARNNILATIKTTTFPGQVIERPNYSLQRTVTQLRNTLLERLESKLSKRAYAFFVSLFFGKSLGDREEHSILWEWFNNWGIAHYLARSGLHIMLLILLWRYFFVLLPMPYKIKELLLLLLALGYASLTFMSISFVRALIMFCIYQVGRIFLLPYHGLYCCILTCCLVLIYNPLELFALDFQLSFLITGALLFFFEYAKRHNSCPQKAL